MRERFGVKSDAAGRAPSRRPSRRAPYVDLEPLVALALTGKLFGTPFYKWGSMESVNTSGGSRVLFSCVTAFPDRPSSASCEFRACAARLVCGDARGSAFTQTPVPPHASRAPTSICVSHLASTSIIPFRSSAKEVTSLSVPNGAPGNSQEQYRISIFWPEKDLIAFRNFLGVLRTTAKSGDQPSLDSSRSRLP